jgi:hypothetical protein
MSTSDDKTSGDNASEAVRSAFAALPFEKKLSTLLRIELDLVGDVADAVAAAASRAVDEVARTFSDPASAPSGEPSPGNQAPTS